MSRVLAPRRSLVALSLPSVLVAVCVLAGPLLSIGDLGGSVAWADEVMLLHPRLFSSNGTTLREASVLRFDGDAPGTTLPEIPVPLTLPMGLAVDDAGRAFVGDVRFDPLRVEMLRFAAGELSTSFGALIDSSILGFISFPGVDAVIRGDDLYFVHGLELDANLEPTRPARLVRLGLSTGATEVVWESSADLSGLAVDEQGNLYVGVLAFDPFVVDLVQIRPDRTRRSLGRVVDSTGGFIAGRPFEVAAQGGAAYFIHPAVVDAEGTLLERESIRRLDLAAGQPAVEIVSTGQGLEGLAVDSRGQVFYGLTAYDPLRVELRRWSSVGEESFGTVIDSGGALLERLKLHMAVRPAPLPGTCAPDDETLCFQDGRFEVRGTWTDFEGGSGPMRTADVGRKDSAAFYFFAPQNLEVLIKLLDACDLGNYWLFYSATTNVGFEIRVRDTVTGAERVYGNAVGAFAEPILDTSAFACDP